MRKTSNVKGFKRLYYVVATNMLQQINIVYMNVYTCNTNFAGFDSHSITWNQDFISFPHLPAKVKYASVLYCSICFVQISESNIYLELYIYASSSFTKQLLFAKRILISRWKYLFSASFYPDKSNCNKK